jgi:hypothetical protein
VRTVEANGAGGPQPEGESKEVDSSDSVETDLSGPKKTFLQELNPLPTIDRTKNLALMLLRPLPIVLYPATIFSALTFASSLGFLIAAISTAGAVFQSPPYNFSAAISGLINLPSFIGIFLGSYCGGGFTDIIAKWQARRNNGVFEPEARLLALIVPFFIVPAGLLMYLPSLMYSPEVWVRCAKTIALERGIHWLWLH